MMDVLLLPLLWLLSSVISLAVWIVLIDVILNMLIMLNIININNRFIYTLSDALGRVTHLLLDPIKKRVDCVFGTIDLSPVIFMLGAGFLMKVIAVLAHKVS